MKWTVVLLLVPHWLAFGQQKSATANIQNSWERMKECAAQAERVAQAEELHIWKPGSADTYAIVAIENHYSSKFERCYMRITRSRLDSAPKDSGPFMYVELLDAFERRELATWTPATEPRFTALFCMIVDEPGNDCVKPRQFIDERMRFEEKEPAPKTDSPSNATRQSPRREQ